MFAMDSDSKSGNHVGDLRRKRKFSPDVHDEGRSPRHDLRTPDTMEDSYQPTPAMTASANPENPVEGLQAPPVMEEIRPEVPNDGRSLRHDLLTPPDTMEDSYQPTPAMAASSDHENSMEGLQASPVMEKNRPDAPTEGQTPWHDHKAPPDTTTDLSQHTPATLPSSDPQEPTRHWKGFIAKKNDHSYVPNIVTEQQPQPHLPEIALSGCEESGLKAMSPVLKQRSYTGRQPVIKSSVANIPCSKFNSYGLLTMLNDTLGTSYTWKMLSKSLQSFLYLCIRRQYDFGTAYAHLRPYWFEDASRDIVEHERNDQCMRKHLLMDNRITNGDTPPRRVWDLYANRVVPYWVVGKYPWAISHAWMNDEELNYVMTPINQNEWPVPIPKDANLDLIRIELLNLGAEYVWVDILCLRQEVGSEQEQKFHEKGKDLCKANGLQREESKVDVPTIGWVYHEAYEVVCYFSGLGRPLTTIDLKSNRCWFNRAWTLQEINMAPITGGITDDPEPDILDTQLAPLRFMRRAGFVFDILSKMQTRRSTKPVHRVAGLVYLFYSEYIPVYQPDQDLEDAWTTLCNVTQDWFRADLFFLYPKPGDGNKIWRPSWNQLMETETETLRRVLDHHTIRVMGAVKQRRDSGTAVDCYHGPCIESCQVRGLGNVADASAQKKPRRGTLCLEDGDGKMHTYKIFVNHTCPIPDDSYTLIGNTVSLVAALGTVWVVGKTEDRGFKKLSMFRMEDDQAGPRLQRLGVAEDREVLLI